MGGQKIRSSHFGRSWRPKRYAMWNLGGIKIEVPAGRRIFFTNATQKFVKICFFLEIGPYPKIFNVKFFRGEYLRNRYALTIQNMYIYRGLTDIFVRVIPARSREMAAKSDVPAKVRSRNWHKKPSQEDFARECFVWPLLCRLRQLWVQIFF